MQTWCPVLQGFHKLYNPMLMYPFRYKETKASWVPDLYRASIIPIFVHTAGPEQRVQQDLWRKLTRRKGKPPGKVALMNLWSTYEGIDTDSFIEHRLQDYEWCSPQFYVHTNHRQHNHMYWDMLWNRQKSFFFDRDERLNNLWWTAGHSDEMWELDEIPKRKEARYTYLSPTRIYTEALRNGNERMQLRANLVEVCNRLNTGLCTYGAPLQAQDTRPNIDQRIREGVDSIWMPIHNRWYNQSYFSAYVESCVGARDGYSSTGSITEKTWDPLVKGHFILPFGYEGIVADIQSYGYKLPEWIDYSYDYVQNRDERWELYAREFERLARMDVREWATLYERERDSLVYNRDLFRRRRYHKLKFPRKKEKNET